MKLTWTLPMLFALLSGCGRTEEEHLQSFITSHLNVVEPKLAAMNRASWNASASGEKKYYDEQAAIELEIRTIYSNKQDFASITAWKESPHITDPLLKRQAIILYNLYLTNQLDTSLMRQIVEKSAAIAEKFNTYRPMMDGKARSDNELTAVLKSGTNSATRKKAWEASKEVGAVVAPMLIELVKLRNQAARQLGFENYYVMSLQAAEQSEAEVMALFDELKILTDAPFRTLKREIDATLAGTYGIRPEEMRPWHYQDRFFQEAPQVGTIDFDRYFKDKHVDSIGTMFYRGIGLPVEDILKNSDIVGRPGKYQHAFETDIDRKGDIRVMLSIVDDHSWMGTMLHELGHGVFSKNVRRDLPFLLRVESHIFLTEAIAQLMERQASNADWLEAMAGLPAKEKDAVRAAGVENIRLKQLVFSRWSQVMVRFEQALYRNPDQDLNRLWWDLVEEYQLVKRPERRNAPDWAAKIHFSQSPVYYHNYQLGELAASQLNHFIIANVLKTPSQGLVCFAGKPEVGSYLRERVFAPGASLRWDDLMKHATEEGLTAKYFAAEFVGK